MADGTKIDSEIVTILITKSGVKFTITTGENAKGKPTLKWAKIPGATKYEVYRASTKNGKYTKTFTTKGTTYTNTAAKMGNTYYYKLKVYLKNGKSATSDIYQNTYEIPEVVFNISTGTNKNGKPAIKWSAIPGAESYEILRADSAKGKFTKLFSTNGTSYTNTSAKAGKTYYYKLVVKLVDGTKETSKVFSQKCTKK